MKKTNIIYWTATVLFGGFMLFSAIPDLIVVPEAVEFVSNKLGYPEYIIPFLGAAKTLGVIALVIPGFPRITEWAYAGLTFDLIGATYSNFAVDGFQPGALSSNIAESTSGLFVLFGRRAGQGILRSSSPGSPWRYAL